MPMHYSNKVVVTRYDNDEQSIGRAGIPWNNHKAWPSQVNPEIWKPCRRLFGPPGTDKVHQGSKTYVQKARDQALHQYYQERRDPRVDDYEREANFDLRCTLQSATLSSQIFKYRRHLDSDGVPLTVGRCLEMDPAYFLAPPPVAHSNARRKPDGRLTGSPQRRLQQSKRNPRLALSFDGTVSHKREFLNDTHRSALPSPGSRFVRSEGNLRRTQSGSRSAPRRNSQRQRPRTGMARSASNSGRSTPKSRTPKKNLGKTM